MVNIIYDFYVKKILKQFLMASSSFLFEKQKLLISEILWYYAWIFDVFRL